MSDKTNSGNFFEDFSLGQQIVHTKPCTLSEGDPSLYTALYGSRFAVNSSDMFAIALGFDAVLSGSVMLWDYCVIGEKTTMWTV